MLQNQLSIHGTVKFLPRTTKTNRHRSLSNAEINAIQDRVREKLTSRFGVELR
jgi:phenylalanyl-tRNA synthetase beta subunit